MREFNKIFEQKFNSEDEFQVAEFYHTNSEMDKINLTSHIQKIDEYYTVKSDSKNQNKDKFPFAEKISLTRAHPKVFSNFYKLLLGRRTKRNFSNKKITLAEISNLLKFSYGKIKVGENAFSTVPSAGAIYPLHIYLLIINTEIRKGIYHYYFSNDYLDELVIDNDFDKLLDEIILIKNLESSPALYFIITSDMRDICLKYGDRGYRFALIESGHLAQNLLLMAENNNLNAIPLGGFFDKEIANLLKIDYSFEKPLYIIALGKK